MKKCVCDLMYRGYQIVSKNDGYIHILDSKGSECKRVENCNHGSLTDAKIKVDKIIKGE